MSIPTIYPLNTFDFVVTLRSARIVSSRVVEVPLEDGPVHAFLALTTSPTAGAADPTLQVEATYSGLGGKWHVKIPGAVLLPSLLATLFASTPPVLMIVQPDNVRVYVQCAYAASRPAVVVS